MQLTRFQKITLGISGATALAIGTFITLAPHAFYASYGITLGPNPNLLSELRAPGAGLAVLGAIMLAGPIRAAMAPIALAVALTVYLAFPVGRIVGIVLDGMPSGSVIGALAIEVVIAGLLLVAFKPMRTASSGRDRIVDQPG
ncbi:membrane protein [Actibacterium mucosum KCTC 23349]|uniref:Membrane protein n=1 Tax=Actibacterium mucosum KCTC 23349 TaxID=1454373 RepID=A0A037ZG68_9RHOB|nr:DUF4345 domain-containing protein [Actibacterium mucosum]KAJ55143.1 membrane protein [Actibacterium mucosum KCTC 23349]